MRALLNALLAAALGLSFILLTLASVPEWVVRGPRIAHFVAHWRLRIAAAGMSTLFAAAIFLIVGG